jgi:haloalkane dehalogenase
MDRWLNRDEYPFSSRYFNQPMGRMHYIDEGEGDHAVVLVHGNPAWSFTYRRLIRCLSGSYRCIAPDHLGFGLSDKPAGWHYRPTGHAENLERLLEYLNPASVTMVVGDWGGPIGLSWALNHPQKIGSLVITNSWMWSVRGVMHYELFSRIMGGAAGRVLIRRYNFFVNVLMKSMFRAAIAPEIQRHYREPLSKSSERKGCEVFPREIIGSSDWLETLWQRRDAISDKPALLLWGMRDIAFRRIELERWQALFRQAETHIFDQAGHFVTEQLGDELCPLLLRHLAACRI